MYKYEERKNIKLRYKINDNNIENIYYKLISSNMDTNKYLESMNYIQLKISNIPNNFNKFNKFIKKDKNRYL